MCGAANSSAAATWCLGTGAPQPNCACGRLSARPPDSGGRVSVSTPFFTFWQGGSEVLSADNVVVPLPVLLPSKLQPRGLLLVPAAQHGRRAAKVWRMKADNERGLASGALARLGAVDSALQFGFKAQRCSARWAQCFIRFAHKMVPRLGAVRRGADRVIAFTRPPADAVQVNCKFHWPAQRLALALVLASGLGRPASGLPCRLGSAPGKSG